MGELSEEEIDRFAREAASEAARRSISGGANTGSPKNELTFVLNDDKYLFMEDDLEAVREAAIEKIEKMNNN